MYNHVQVHRDLNTYIHSETDFFWEDVYVYICMYKGLLKVKRSGTAMMQLKTTGFEYK